MSAYEELMIELKEMGYEPKKAPKKLEMIENPVLHGNGSYYYKTMLTHMQITENGRITFHASRIFPKGEEWIIEDFTQPVGHRVVKNCISYKECKKFMEEKVNA